jgi:hypothetical protein
MSVTTVAGMSAVAPMSVTTVAAAVAIAARQVDAAAADSGQAKQGGKRQETSTHGSRFLPVAWCLGEAAQRTSRLPHLAAR